MKRINYFIWTLLLLASAASCVDNEFDNRIFDNTAQNTITAVMEQSGTRTSLSQLSEDIYRPLWKAEDNLAVIPAGADAPSLYTLVKGEGTSEGVFTGAGKSSAYVAYYPYEGFVGFKGKTLDVMLPSEQYYEEGSFSSGAYPMLAVSDTEAFQFRNLCSILKVSLKGSNRVSSIVFKSASDEVKVAGAATISLDFDTVPSLKMASDAVNEVRLICDGATLEDTQAKDFYIVIPAQTYKGGFTLQVIGPDGVMTKSTDEDVVMERAQIRAIPVLTYEPVAAVKPSDTLEGAGSEDSPFLINNLSDLLLLQQQSNIIGGKIKGVEVAHAYYRQTADISLAPVCGKGVADWQPIADYATNQALEFDGSYDGDGHSITDLYINAPKTDYRGFFGHHVGRLVNLGISGEVIGNNYVGLAVGTYFNCHRVDYTCIENVVVSGYVEGNKYVGGLSGEYSAIYGSVNKATVVGNVNVGGFAGVTNHSVEGCLNEGKISGGSYVGGLVGYHNSGNVINCMNKGAVVGSSHNVGGLTGYSRQGAKVLNNINYGEVSGKHNVGGVCGFCSDDSTRDGATAVRNNVNIGDVYGNQTNKTAAICGYNTDEVTHNYWLYDPAHSKGMAVGVNNSDGTVAENVPLTEGQLKGETGVEPYYVSGTDSYYELVDALTAWAADNTDTSQWDDPIVLGGWIYSSETGYPEVTTEPAQKPQGGIGTDPTFEILTDRYEVSCYPSEIQVEVKTNMSYSISSKPDWISEEKVVETGYGYIHVFAIAENTDPVVREGVIVFCNENQMCIPVTVIQEQADPIGDEWKSKEFHHRSLAMRFTADWCGYCPMMASAIHGAQELMPNKIEAVSMHASGGLGFAQAYELVETFNVGGFPTLIMDSRADVPNYSPVSYTSGLIKSVLEETESSYPTKTGISFKTILSGQQIKADVKLYIKDADEYKVTVLLLEDHIIGYQSGVGNSYEHNDVVRLSLSDISGDLVSVKEGNTVWTGSFAGTIPAGCDPDNLRVLVYVEKPYGNHTFVSGVTNVNYSYYNGMYVDNCRSEKIGVEAVLQFADDLSSGVYESSDYSSDGVVNMLQKASKGNGIDIVLMGDAFSDRLIADGTYDEVMRTAYERFFDEEPYRSFKDHFNVYSVNVVSKNEIYGGETALEGYFGDGTQVGGNDQKCFEYALKAIDSQRLDAALIIVMMNSKAYAGTCYMYYGYEGDYGNGVSVSYFPIGIDEQQLAQLLHHEAGGHGFAKLADEYSYEEYGKITAEAQASYESMKPLGWWKNVDFTNDPAQVRWSYFLEDERYADQGLGVFEGGLTYWSGVWRPSENSIMRYNTGGFNAPSREAIYYRINKLAYGPDWKYDYEAFVEFDAAGRKSSSAAQRTRANYVERTYEPTAPPVVINKSWREASAE